MNSGDKVQLRLTKSGWYWKSCDDFRFFFPSHKSFALLVVKNLRIARVLSPFATHLLIFSFSSSYPAGLVPVTLLCVIAAGLLGVKGYETPSATHRMKVQLRENTKLQLMHWLLFSSSSRSDCVCVCVYNYERKSVSTNRDLKLMRRQMERRWFFFSPPSIIKTCRNVDSLPTYNYQVILMCNGKLWLVFFFFFSL